jgi:hypothetical protein
MTHENWRRDVDELKAAKRYDEAVALARAAIEALASHLRGWVRKRG